MSSRVEFVAIGLTSLSAAAAYRFIGWKTALGVTVFGSFCYAVARRIIGPKYWPGLLSSKLRKDATLLDPPIADVDETTWRVETANAATKKPIDLHHFSVGSGPIQVLVLHGGPACPPKTPWPALELLAQKQEDEESDAAKRFTFHFYHQRGSGKSTKPFSVWNTKQSFAANFNALRFCLGAETQVADIERIRRKLCGETGQIVIIGHSFGGFLASCYAAEFPSMVSKLVLITPAPFLEVPSKEDFMEALRQSLSARFPEKVPALDAWYAQLMKVTSAGMTEDELATLNQSMGRDFYLPVQLGKIQSEEGAKRFQQQLLEHSMPMAGFGAFGTYMTLGMRHSFTKPIRNLVQQRQMPTLVLHAEWDVQTETSTHEYLKAFPQAKYEVVQQSGHAPMYEKPEELAAIVGRFLAEQ